MDDASLAKTTKPLLKWSDAYSVGDPRLDWDHRGLMDVINSLTLDVQGAHLDQEGLRARILALIESQEDHDAREEAILASLNFPGFSEHRQNHVSLESRLKAFVAAPLERSEREDLLDFLKDWFIQHVLVQDMHYKTHILESRERG
ncbi:MAG: hemerythrin [Rhodospirillum sp.]|nr:hemerythrin [Rhodospirillum sp.]MCF8488901.1 hemerythrin [Rhodospirillum sp.]MCF8500037.1 hemerythrin [Rhodospirillum sp.]